MRNETPRARANDAISYIQKYSSQEYSQMSPEQIQELSHALYEHYSAISILSSDTQMSKLSELWITKIADINELYINSKDSVNSILTHYNLKFSI